MKRITLTDGRWFDRDAADRYDEDTRWDGHNHITVATGSQWNHEELYRTKGGRYVLRSWSQWQGSRERYQEIDKRDAAAWLIANGHSVPLALAPEVKALEVA